MKNINNNIIKNKIIYYKSKIKNIKDIKKKYKILKKFKKLKKILKIKKNINKKKKIIFDLENLTKKEEDFEMINLIKEEIKKVKEIIKILKNKIKKIKKIDRKKEKIIIEIIKGVGGLESEIFISDLKKMYEKYFEKMGWKKRILLKNKGNIKGYKEIILIIKGKNIYKNLKYESGVHRVQRLPETENKGRIHTSTCRVAIYRYSKKKNFKIEKDDLKIETFKSSGAGGQHVNKTNSAVRIKHIPTGLSVECQKERSQHKNKKYALKILENKIIKKNIEENKNKSKKIKKKLFGKGERVEKIRTYNYKNKRITDHRFNITTNRLEWVMQGNLEEIIKKIKKYDNKKNK